LARLATVIQSILGFIVTGKRDQAVNRSPLSSVSQPLQRLMPGLNPKSIAAGLGILVALGWATASPGFSLLSLLHLGDEATMRYRVEVTLRVDGQLVRGSAVQEMTATSEIRTIPGTGGGLSARARGEAVVVNLPGRPSLFFLMAGPEGGGWPEGILASCNLNAPDPDPVARLDRFRGFTGPCLLDRYHQPRIVRFDDERNIEPVYEVHLPESAGPDGDVDLVSVTIERTDQPLTEVLIDRLPWLAGAAKRNPDTFTIHTIKHGTTLVPITELLWR
jgi:hypothetical protein